MRYGILILIMLFTSTISSAQDFTISGTVTDSTDGTYLPGVNIILEGTTIGTSTNLDGEYILKITQSQASNGVLLFSYIGYVPKRIPINGQNTIEIAMLASVHTMKEVVVVGYGSRQKSLLTGSISQVSSEDIAGLPISRVEEALEGKTAGVSVLPASGSPGAGMNVRIRGTSSNRSSQPLYIVDGMRTGDINNISPSDIESIEILKDAASASIYGAEGANGVVLINTKNGQPGESRITYESKFGIQDAGDLVNTMSANQYKTYMTEAGISVNTASTDADTDWMDETFETAPMQQHYLSFSGGDNNSTYMISGSYYNQDGIVGLEKANFERYTARFNSTHDVKNWLSVGNNLSYSSFARSAIVEDNVFGGVIANALMFDPLTPVTFSGTPDIIQNALDAGNNPTRNDDGEFYGVSRNVFGEIFNPLADIQNSKGETTEDKVLGNVFADIKPIENLQIRSRIGIDYANQLYHTWTPTYWYSTERQNNQTSVRDNNNEWYTWLWENYARYEQRMDKHNIIVLGGISAESSTHKYTTTLSGPIFREDGSFAQHGTVEIDGSVSGNKSINKQASFYGRFNYDYDDKYLFEVAFRADGSSLLAEGNRWGYFPAFSLGWVMSSEDFWSLDMLTFAKLRASWGQNGSLSNLAPDAYRALITTTGIRYPNAGGGYYTGAEPDVLANPELTWETSTQTNIGLDLRAMKDKLRFTADWYNKVTEDLLTPGAPPLSVGNDPSFVNAGDVTNTGFEFELGYSDFSKDFTYDISFTMSVNDNEVTYLNPLLERISGNVIGTGWTATYFEEGRPVWYFRGYETDGIFQNQGQIDQYKAENGGLDGYNPVPGDPIVVNTNGDNVINSDDQTMIGSPHPDMILGSSITFEYKGVDLGVFVSGSFGNDIILGWNRVDRATTNRPEFFFSDRWTGENSTNDWFRASLTDPYAYQSDLMVFDGSYIRIKQIELGYTLPASMSTQIGIQRARIFFSLNNFFTFTDYPGVDPVAGSNNIQSLGIDRGVYPTPRIMMTGISLNL